MRKVHLRRAKSLQNAIRGNWTRGVPSRLIQVNLETEISSARRSREREAEAANRLVDRAFRVLRASGEQRQGYADGENSTTTGWLQ